MRGRVLCYMMCQNPCIVLFKWFGWGICPIRTVSSSGC